MGDRRGLENRVLEYLSEGRLGIAKEKKEKAKVVCFSRELRNSAVEKD